MTYPTTEQTGSNCKLSVQRLRQPITKKWINSYRHVTHKDVALIMAHVQTEEKVIKGYKTSILFLISTVHSFFYIQGKKTWPTSMLILE